MDSIRYSVIPRRVSLLIYGKQNLNYTSVLQISIMGDRGTIDSLNGRDFYALIKQTGLKPFRDLGLQTITAAMTAAHYRLAKRELAGIVDVRRTGETRVGPASLLWVELRELVRHPEQ